MKLYRITNPRFAGEVVVIYNAGLLESISFSDTNLGNLGRTNFKQTIPAIESDIATAFKTAETIIVSEDVQISFEMFWEKYDLKRNKDRCISLWERLNKTERVLAYHNIKNYDKILKRTNQYKMHPDTWLRNKLFNDYTK